MRAAKESSDAVQQHCEEIVDAAERCVFAAGLHQLKLRDIARESGNSLGNIYNYFKNKEEIVEVLVERQTSRFLSTVTRSTEEIPDETHEERVLRQISVLVDAYMDPESMRLSIFIASEALVNPRVLDICVAANRRVCEHVIDVIRHDPNCHIDVTDEEIEVRIVSVRSYLEGLRGSLLFNPTMNRKLMRDRAIERLRVLWRWDQAKAQGKTFEDVFER